MGLRIAIFGEAQEAADVLVRLSDAGHDIVGVYAPPEGRRPDPLAAEAQARGLRLLRYKRFRRRGRAIPAIVDEYRQLGAELNVMPYTTVFLPLEILDAPRHRSLCRHPSLLPRFRGGASIGWQIIEGEAECGVSVFIPDEGVDAGPVVVQKGGVRIADSDNAARLYYEKLKDLGVEAMVEAVQQVADGSAKPVVQDESKATWQPLITDDVARIDWSRPGLALGRLVRGCDPSPGAFGLLRGDTVRFHDARFDAVPGGDAEPGTVLAIDSHGVQVAVPGGRITARRVRVGDGAKLPAAESGLGVGDRLETPPAPEP